MEKLVPGVAVPITHVQCRQCGHDMPADADRCLHCGQVTRRVRVRQVLLVVACGCCWFCWVLGFS